MNPLFPERMVFVEWTEFVVQNWHIGSNLLDLVPHFFLQNYVVLHHLINRSLFFWCFNLKRENARDVNAERFRHRIPAVSAADVLIRAIVPGYSSLELQQTLAAIASNHRGS